VSTCGHRSRGNPDEGQGVVREESGAQLVEFAVALPLLIVFVVGIFDFSGAFTLKQKLTNVARDAARAAAAAPSNDLSSTTPASVNAAFQIVNNYFVANHLNTCNVAAAGSSGLTWTYSGTTGGCPPAGLKIIINRSYYFPATSAATIANANCTPTQSAGSQTAVISTCVSIEYAYAWRFGQVASLLGTSAVLPATITATAVAMNED
jgi:Flp pilus assembly protein TadG